MGSSCCCQFSGRRNRHSDDEEVSVDSEPYSPKIIEVSYTVGNVDSGSLGQIEEEHQSGYRCRPPSLTHDIERDTYRSKTTALASDSSYLTKAKESNCNAHKLSQRVSESSKILRRMNSYRSWGCASPANTEKNDNESSATKHIGKDLSFYKGVVQKEFLARNTSFRWEHDYEEPYRMDKTPDRDSNTTNRSASPASSQGSEHPREINGSRNGLTDLQFMEDWETDCCYIYVLRTGQRILNHNELRHFMDELLLWTMQVPGTTTLRYKHMTTGLDVSLPWPDLRTGTTKEIGKFVDTVNSIEGRKIFHYFCMEHYKNGPPCFLRPPPSPPKSFRSRFSKSLSGHRKWGTDSVA